MSTAASILADLKKKGSESVRRIYASHGMAPDRVYGVKIGDLKPIAKSLRGKQALACDLFATGNLEAMYLGGMVADGAKLSAEQLNAWLAGAADLQMIFEYTIPWLAGEHPQVRELALEWIGSKQPHIAAAGWNTYAGFVATRPDAALDLSEIRQLMKRVVHDIHTAPNRVRACMNNFIITVGACVAPLLDEAKSIARTIGKVKVDVGDTQCKIPLASAYIEKIESMGRVGRKRKTMRC